MKLAPLFRAERFKQGLLQKEVAALASMNPRYYQEIETGEHAPSLVALYKISVALGKNFFSVDCDRDAEDEIEHDFLNAIWEK